MVVLEPSPRDDADRRFILDRRIRPDRRSPATATTVVMERRIGGDRRASTERRLALQSAEDQIHGALRLLTTIADDRALGEPQRRHLEAAMLRLRFALERLTPPKW